MGYGAQMHSVGIVEHRPPEWIGMHFQGLEALGIGEVVVSKGIHRFLSQDVAAVIGQGMPAQAVGRTVKLHVHTLVVHVERSVILEESVKDRHGMSSNLLGLAKDGCHVPFAPGAATSVSLCQPDRVSQALFGLHIEGLGGPFQPVGELL